MMHQRVAVFDRYGQDVRALPLSIEFHKVAFAEFLKVHPIGAALGQKDDVLRVAQKHALLVCIGGSPLHFHVQRRIRSILFASVSGI